MKKFRISLNISLVNYGQKTSMFGYPQGKSSESLI